MNGLLRPVQRASSPNAAGPAGPAGSGGSMIFKAARR